MIRKRKARQNLRKRTRKVLIRQRNRAAWASDREVVRYVAARAQRPEIVSTICGCELCRERFKLARKLFGPQLGDTDG